MARSKGQFVFAANFEVKAAAALDPRVMVATKAELITKETWPYDGDTIYLYEGILVSVQEENAVYMLVDYDKVLAEDYSGWLRVDAGNAEQVEVVDNLESDASNKALSAKQGKVLMGEIADVKAKLVNIYTYKGSVETFEELPADAVAGDVWNVAAAHEGHAAGTNYAWVADLVGDGGHWDALAGSIDLSNYFNKEEVAAAIKAEADRADAEEKRLAGLIEANATLAAAANTLASDNQTALAAVSVQVGNLNLLLNGNDNPDDDIEDQIGVIGRLSEVEGKNAAQDERLTNLEKLVSGGEAGEGGTTLLEMVNTNAGNISALTLRVKANEDAIALLNGNAQTAGSVDYKIAQAFAWVEVE